MILISAALVLAAIVLLIAGVVLGTPPLVMWSIVVSVLSAVCLLIGALLRRHELFPAGGRAAEGTAPTPQGSSVPQLAHVGAVSGAYGGALVGAPAHPVATPMVAAPPVTHHGALPPQTFPPQRTGPITRSPAGSGRGLAPDAIVLVIPGRKRFHLATCRQLVGRETEELTHEEAREEGFTPCTTCLPESSTRTAEPDKTPHRGDAARDDTARDESMRAEAPTTTTPSAGTSGTTGREPSRSTPADREPPVARFPQPGVPGPRLPESSVSELSGLQSSAPGASDPGASPAAAPPASGPSTAAPSTPPGGRPSDDVAREKTGETAEKASGKTSGKTADAGEVDEHDGPARDTASEADAGTEGDGHTPVNWFGRGTSPESGAGTAVPRSPSTPPSSTSPSSTSQSATPPSSPSAASSGSSSGSSAPSWPSATSWSAPAWSPPAAGSASDQADDETDDSLTDTAEHDWFVPGRVPLPWDPARSKATGEAGKETSSPGDGEPDGSTAVDQAPGSPAASLPKATASRADDEQPGDDQSASGAADAKAASRPEDAPTPRRAGPGKPVEPAETPGSGRAGSAASAGSTSGSASAAESTANKGVAEKTGSGNGTDKAGTDKAGTEKTGAEKTGAEKSAKKSAEKTGSAREDGAGKGDGAAAATRGAKAATSGSGSPASTGRDGEDRSGSGSETGEDRTADAAQPSADGDALVRVMIGTRRYHEAGCPLISGMGDSGIETMTRAEADEANLTPCSVCQNDR
ncbi:hypothetical protein [Microbispora bryophytorum]|uniref:Uncharacterized protein n=1 Tax=Microbispora bryophytorum TaxID=1460882 RepID=A0A8H9LAB1_9ACTN|nr:hypothetical protein [Microbispora bryophytorum]MBD3134807.1 hypothetical protein [Microbispora bryophytorum]TQS08931.1 hypothetical protein FLX07_06795 [Microbispora bryophytorum]GGO12162.1 hypothetical protein GCM10011574_30410 [Microbispora bryophytorum]